MDKILKKYFGAVSIVFMGLFYLLSGFIIEDLNLKIMLISFGCIFIVIGSVGIGIALKEVRNEND